MSITVEQAQEARAALEGRILLALERFRVETGLTVTQVSLRTVTMQPMGQGERSLVEAVTVRVEL